jgi:hypothetical protein
MGFNRKSDAGPYEGVQSQQRYMSDVLYGYFPLLIPALDYNLFGCNAMFQDPSFKIHEAYGVNTTIEKSVVGVAETISIEQDVDVSATVSVTHNGGMPSTEYYYSILTMQSYKYDNEVANTTVTEFSIPNSYMPYLFTGTLYYPNVPILMPYKFLREKTGPKSVFALGQVQIPVLRAVADGDPVTENADLQYSCYVPNQKFNNQLYGKTVLGIDNAYVNGDSPSVTNSSLHWSDKAGSTAGHLKGIAVQHTNTNAGLHPDPVMIVVYGSGLYSYGITMSVVPVGVDAELWMYDINNSNSRSFITGMIYVPDFGALNTACGVTLSGVTSISNNSATQTAAFIRYMYAKHSLASTVITTFIMPASHAAPTASSTTSSNLFITTDATNGFAAWLLTTEGITLSSYASLNLLGWSSFWYPIATADNASPGVYTIPIMALSYPTLVKTFTLKGKVERQYNGNEYPISNVVIGFKLEGQLESEYGLLYGMSYDRASSFHDLYISLTEEIVDATITVGYYQNESSLVSSVLPAWIKKLLAFANENINSNKYNPLIAYMLDKTTITTTGQINDPALYNTKMMQWFRSSVNTSPSYAINTLVNGVSDDFTDEPERITNTTIALLQQSNRTTEDKIIFVDSLKQEADLLVIAAPTISSIISLSDTYDLTYVKYNGVYAYLGILNTDTLDHYTPRNIFNNTTVLADMLLFTKLPVIDSIKIIKSSPDNLELLIAYIDEADKEAVIYMTLSRVKSIGAGVLYNDTLYREEFVLQEYKINPANNQIMAYDPEIKDHGEVYDFLVLRQLGGGIKKSIRFIEYDDNVVLTNSHNSGLHLNVSSVSSFYSHNFMKSANIIVKDTSDFVSNAYAMPMIHPIDTLIPYNDDAGYVGATYADLTPGTNDLLLQQVLYYSTRMMNYYPDGNHSIGNIDRQPKTGTLIFGTLPSIDKTVKNYSILPEKAITAYGVDDYNNLSLIGTNSFGANDKAYTVLQNNMYLSSKFSLVPANRYGLFNIEGKIFNTGNLFFITDGRQTHVYAVEDNSIPKFMKTLDGIIVCDPVNVGGDIIVVCNNGIHTYKNGVIYNFDINVTVADMKPITGNGYLLYIYSDTDAVEVPLRAMDGTALVAMDDDTLTVTGFADNYRAYHVNDSLHVIRLSISETGYDPSEMHVIKNNCYGATTNIYPVTAIPAGGATYKPWAYTVKESGTYHTDPYIISEPVQLRNQKAEQALADAVFLYCIGYGTMQFRLYDGAQLIVDKTITIGTNNADKHDEYKIELGMIVYDNLYYRIDFVPGSDNSLKIQTVKIRVNYLQEI